MILQVSTIYNYKQFSLFTYFKTLFFTLLYCYCFFPLSIYFKVKSPKKLGRFKATWKELWSKIKFKNYFYHSHGPLYLSKFTVLQENAFTLLLFFLVQHLENIYCWNSLQNKRKLFFYLIGPCSGCYVKCFVICLFFSFLFLLFNQSRQILLQFNHGNNQDKQIGFNR